jgi:hypothetical protein
LNSRRRMVALAAQGPKDRCGEAEIGKVHQFVYHFSRPHSQGRVDIPVDTRARRAASW